jgi:hypothetical protein
MGVRKVPGEWVPGKAVHGIELEIGHRDPRHAVARPEEVTAHDARHVTALALALAEGLGAQDARVADSSRVPVIRPPAAGVQSNWPAWTPRRFSLWASSPGLSDIVTSHAVLR